MSNTQDISNLLNGLPQLERKIIEEILIPNNAFAVKGRTINMRFSEITYLPDELAGGFKLPMLTYEVMGQYMVMTQMNTLGKSQKQVKSYNTNLKKLQMDAAGKGVWSGFEVKTHASKLDRFRTTVHPVWGNIVAEKELEFLQEAFPGGYVDMDKRRIATVTTANPILYLFMLFYPTIDSDLIAPIRVSGRAIRFKKIDLHAESKDEVSYILVAHDAIQWVRNLGKPQLQLLKNKVVPVVGGLGGELSAQTTVDGMKEALIKLCQRHGADILRFKDEVGGEVPREAVAKSVLADAITVGILEPNKELGLLIGMAHENTFEGLCPRINVDAIKNTRLQFMQPATPSEWYGYISANENLTQVQSLETLVEKLVPKFEGKRFMVGNYPQLTSLMKTSGRLKNLYNEK